MNKDSIKKIISDIAIASVIAIFFMADRFLKMLALQLTEKISFTLIKNLFYFNLTKNYYIAFSLPLSGFLLELAIGIIIICILCYLINLSIYKKDKKLEIILFSAIFLGAISNLFDRLKYGYVIDYLELKHFSVFNLADCLISIGAILLIIKNIKTNK